MTPPVTLRPPTYYNSQPLSNPTPTDPEPIVDNSDSKTDVIIGAGYIVAQPKLHLNDVIPNYKISGAGVEDNDNLSQGAYVNLGITNGWLGLRYQLAVLGMAGPNYSGTGEEGSRFITTDLVVANSLMAEISARTGAFTFALGGGPTINTFFVNDNLATTSGTIKDDTVHKTTVGFVAQPNISVGLYKALNLNVGGHFGFGGNSLTGATGGLNLVF